MRFSAVCISAVVAVFVGSMVSSTYAAEVSVAGDVFYRERIGLPDSAELTVSLVKIEDPAAEAVASISVHPTGQVPIVFKLSVDPSKLDSGSPYGLNARIRAEGQDWFATSKPHPLDVNALADPVSIMVTRVVNEPDQSAEAAPTSIRDVVWRLQTLDGSAAHADVHTTITFSGDGSVHGNGGCNRFGSQAKFKGQTLKLERAFSTMMACEESVSHQEGLFLERLNQVSSYRIEGDKLILLDSAEKPIMDFVKTP